MVALDCGEPEDPPTVPQTATQDRRPSLPNPGPPGFTSPRHVNLPPESRSRPIKAIAPSPPPDVRHANATADGTDRPDPTQPEPNTRRLRVVPRPPPTGRPRRHRRRPVRRHGPLRIRSHHRRRPRHTGPQQRPVTTGCIDQPTTDHGRSGWPNHPGTTSPSTLAAARTTDLTSPSAASAADDRSPSRRPVAGRRLAGHDTRNRRLSHETVLPAGTFRMERV